MDINIFKVDDAAKYLPKIERTYENEDFYDEVAENSDEIFAIGYGDEVIGLAYIEDDDKEGFVYVFIFPEYRGRGFGHPAVEAAERQIKTSPAKIMTGYGAYDAIAKTFAERCGYAKQFSSSKMKYAGGKFEEKELPEILDKAAATALEYIAG